MLEWDADGSPVSTLHGREIVRGAQEEMPVEQQPSTKFDALLDGRHCVDAIRRGFLECYGANLVFVQQCLERTIVQFFPEGRCDPQIHALQEAVADVCNLRQPDFGVEPCYFREEIWRYYLAAIEYGHGHSSHWLSYDELLAVAIIADTQLIIVQERDDGFHYRGDTLDAVSRRVQVEPIIVSIRGAGHRRIESHFERLLSRTQFDSVVREERQTAERVQRELKAMQQEDVLALGRRFHEQANRPGQVF